MHKFWYILVLILLTSCGGNTDEAANSSDGDADSDSDSDSDSDTDSDSDSDTDTDSDTDSDSDSDTDTDADADADTDADSDSDADTDSDTDGGNCQYTCSDHCLSIGGTVMDGSCEDATQKCCDLGGDTNSDADSDTDTDTDADTESEVDTEDTDTGGFALDPVTDYKAAGPFETTVETNVGPGGKYTVFRPKTLGENGLLHAPIVFGPGIGQSVTVHTVMLTNFASHGFIVVGTPVLNEGPNGLNNLASMKNGIDWIVEQNTTAGTYQGKVWVDHVISMGFSVGGTAAVDVGDHEAVASVVSIHGHISDTPLHGTLFQTTGTADTVGLPMQQQTYENSDVPTFMATLTGAPHGYIEGDGGGEERPAILAWMRYWIYGDEGARKYFFGNDCILCSAPWENPQRKNWTE